MITSPFPSSVRRRAGTNPVAHTVDQLVARYRRDHPGRLTVEVGAGDYATARMSLPAALIPVPAVTR